MGERESHHEEPGDHETLTAADMLAFWSAYEAAQREMGRMRGDRGVEAVWHGKIRAFLDEVSREISV